MSHFATIHNRENKVSICSRIFSLNEIHIVFSISDHALHRMKLLLLLIIIKKKSHHGCSIDLIQSTIICKQNLKVPQQDSHTTSTKAEKEHWNGNDLHRNRLALTELKEKITFLKPDKVMV